MASSSSSSSSEEKINSSRLSTPILLRCSSGIKLIIALRLISEECPFIGLGKLRKSNSSSSYESSGDD